MARFERFAQYLSPLLKLEQRLIRQLAFPDEDDDPVEVDLLSPTSSLPSHIGLPVPASQRQHFLQPHTKGGELALRSSSNWKKSWSFGGHAEPKSAHTGELRGWWEDSRDPVHVLHACASGNFGIRALWHDSDVRMTLARRRVRMEESAGFYLDDVERITALKYIPVGFWFK